MAAEPPVLEIRGPLRREDLPGLYDRACAEFGRLRGCVLTVDVTGVAANAVAVDALARLLLAGRRHGWRIAVRGADRALSELIALIGLNEVFLSPAEAEARTAGTASRSRGRT
ncbi:MAG TPA: STAS domain-containing protein [Solirubrobacteraceae bacterium]